MAITREQAEEALACIKEQFKEHIAAGYEPPVLFEGWTPPVMRRGQVVDGDPVPFAILWDEGPDEWAYRARTGGRDVELTLELRSVPGVSEDAVVDTPPASRWPAGVREEPYYAHVLGLYED